MLKNGGSELPKPPLRIKQDDKFYCRLLSKETSIAQPSFRVYYGVAPGPVPFQWESQPGTPKHAAAAASVDLRPPLTPPPSYYCGKSKSGSKKQPSGRSGLSRIFFLRRLSLLRKSTSLSSSSSSSSSISNAGASHHRRLSSWSRSSTCSYRTDDEDSSSLEDGSPTSTLCFGRRRRCRLLQANFSPFLRS